MTRTFNFSAGPATMPTTVLESVRDELLDFQGTGISVMEMSHRGKIFDAVYQESIANLRKLAQIPEDFDILYMTGGASAQFALVPMNLSGSGRAAGYVNTGAWSEKAIKEAKAQSLDVFDAGTSKETNHNHIPAEIKTKAGLDYLHITSNNTIFGTQFQSLPNPGDTQLVIDMSSDFLSKPIDWTNIGIAYAGTQKNAGPSGLTVVIIRKSYYEREKESVPAIYRYTTYAKNDSMYNTPPTFQIYVFGLILKWIESQGGLSGIAQHNENKAKLIYDVIDEFPDFFKGHAQKDSRSLMNVTWNFANADLNAVFLAESQKRKLDGLKGHRSVGGLRASIYNAMPEAGCKALADFMREFQQEHS
ncbi:MAG: 3-phosphoserine/phosphohydroxythreonine transaminase [bacterium]|nr:3-phosphoserine/phosphohydroxythreonine transaminase [bacterium]